MAWSIVGVGTSVEVTATAHALTVPAGVAAGDLLVACIASRIASTTSITLPTGGEWTLVSEQKANNVLTTGNAVASAMMAYCVRGASNPNLTFTHPAAPAPALGRIVAYRGGATPTASAKDTQAAATTAVSITAVNLAGLTTTQANDLIVAMLAGGQEAAWSVFKSANAPTTASGATDTTTAPSTTAWIERADVQTTTSNDTSLGIFDAVKTAAGATGNFTATASVAASHALVAGAFKIAPPSTADAWNVNDKDAVVTLSASDKTASFSGLGGVRSTTSLVNGNAGKYYAEFIYTVGFFNVGVLPLPKALNDAGVGSMAIALAIGDGTVRINGSNLGTVMSAPTAGDVLCLAWDTGAKRVWWRKNAGNWNNSGSADPATGSGGTDASVTTSSVSYALWGFGNTGQTATLRTELAEYTQAVPSGFTSWMGETPAGVSISAPVTGVEATGAIDAVTVVGKAVAAVTGVEGTASVGATVWPVTDRQYMLGGPLGATFVSETSDRSYALAGGYVAETIDLGGPSPDVTVGVTGVSATGSVGSVTVATVASVSVPVTGVQATGAVDQVTAVGRTPVSVAVTGVQAAGAVDAVTIVGKANVALTGVAASGSVGTVTVAAATGVSVPVTGVEATGAVGTVTVSTVTRVDVSAPVTGVEATGSVGSVSVIGKASTTVTGVQATGAVGTVTVVAGTGASVPVTGIGAAGQVGSVTATGKAVATVTGVQAAGSVGSVTVTAGTGVTVPVTGVAAAGSVDSVSITGKVNVPVTGVSATSTLGGVSVTAGGSISTVVTGVQATGNVGNVSVVSKSSIPVTGVSASAAVGSVIATGKAVAAVTGVQATASVGTVTVVTEEAAEGLVGVWTGSAWVDRPAKVWTGSAWAQKPVKHWSGSAWI